MHTLTRTKKGRRRRGGRGHYTHTHTRIRGTYKGQQPKKGWGGASRQTHSLIIARARARVVMRNQPHFFGARRRFQTHRKQRCNQQLHTKSLLSSPVSAYADPRACKDRQCAETGNARGFCTAVGVPPPPPPPCRRSPVKRCAVSEMCAVERNTSPTQTFAACTRSQQSRLCVW